MEQKEAIHLCDRTDIGINYSVTIHEIDAIFSTFETRVGFVQASNVT